MSQQYPRRIESIIGRLIKLAEGARACGQKAKADELLLRAWVVYDQAERYAPELEREELNQLAPGDLCSESNAPRKAGAVRPKRVLRDVQI